jgi:hypothetical protein
MTFWLRGRRSSWRYDRATKLAHGDQMAVLRNDSLADAALCLATRHAAGPRQHAALYVPPDFAVAHHEINQGSCPVGVNARDILHDANLPKPPCRMSIHQARVALDLVADL